MKIVTLPDVVLNSSSIPVNYYLGAVISAWVSAAYSVGNLVYDGATTPHYVYKCKTAIVAAGTDQVPSLDSSRWELIGTTDRWAMFDNMRNTQSQYLESFSGEVSGAGCDYVGLYNLDAVEVELTHMVGLEEIKTEVLDLRNPISSADWWEYFFEDITLKTTVVWAFPRYGPNSRLLFRVTHVSTAIAKCGVLRPGVTFDIGNTQKGLSTRLVDYSNKSSSSLPMVVPGGSGDDIDLTLMLRFDKVDAVHRAFKANCGKAAIYDCNNEGDEILESFILYALFRDFERVFRDGRYVRCTVRLQGLT